MKTQLREFTFDNLGTVRAYQDENMETWFVGSDVAKALAYENPSRDVQRHCKKVNKITRPTATVDGKNSPPVTFLVIPESDLFRLIMRSKQPRAEAFQDWVCEEVLPQLRKTGQYAPKSAPKPKPRPAHDEIAHIITTVAHATRFTFIPNALALELMAEALRRNGFPCHSLR